MEEKNGIIRQTKLLDAEGKLNILIEIQYNEFQRQVFGEEINTPNDIIDVLRAVGASAWEDLINHPVRVKATDEEIHEIGHYLEDKWYKKDDNDN